jgi:arginase
MEIVSRDTLGFGVSIDIDAIDPREAPGVGSPEANGICADALLKGLRSLHNKAELQALEISEYNPYRDRNDATAALMAEMITAVLSEEEQP